MGVRAVLDDGSERELDPKYGQTVQEVVDSLTEDSLTGSAVPLDDVLVVTADGGQLVYGDVARFVDGALF
jgi:hypothetical protein